MIKVRFHLGAGENYLKWQVRRDGRVEYYDPEQYQLYMYNCQLKNHRKTAEKIHAGENKTVCAWIKCRGLFVHKITYVIDLPAISYNPKKYPYWVNSNNMNIDDEKYETLISIGRKLFIRK